MSEPPGPSLVVRKPAPPPKPLETAFLPAALEILETPPSPIGRLVLWLIMAFLAIALAWACLAKIDIVASAPGRIAPRGEVKLIQAADMGVVRAILVENGQSVTAGQALIELDPTVSAAEAEQARQALATALLDEARAQALADHASGIKKPFTPPTGAAPEAAATQAAFVAARIGEFETQIAALLQERAQRAADSAMVSAEVEKLDAQLPLITSRLSGMRTLAQKGLAPRMRVDELEERAIGLRQDRAIRAAELTKNAAALAAVESRIGEIRSAFRREALDALTEAKAAVALRAEELKKAEDKSTLTVLRAPIDGVVQQLALNTIGGVVKPADQVMVIVPRDVELIVEALVLNKDIGFVRAGQSAEIKVESFPFTRFGVVHATVAHVSPTAIKDEQLGLVYACRLRLSAVSIQPLDAAGSAAASGKAGGTIMPKITSESGASAPDDVRLDRGDAAGLRLDPTRLQPGMSVTAEIKTGQRPVIDFLLSPLARRVGEAGRER